MKARKLELEFVTGRIEVAKFDALFGVKFDEWPRAMSGRVEKSSGINRKSRRWDDYFGKGCPRVPVAVVSF